jgi:hypothetical protein
MRDKMGLIRPCRISRPSYHAYRAYLVYHAIAAFKGRGKLDMKDIPDMHDKTVDLSYKAGS